MIARRPDLQPRVNAVHLVIDLAALALAGAAWQAAKAALRRARRFERQPR